VTGEFAAIEKLRNRLPHAMRPGEIWIGDDAAVVRSPGAGWVLLAADTVVAGVHADLSLTGLDDFGWKAMAASLSDIAAMGGRPGHALVTVAGPRDADLDRLYDGLGAAADRFDCPIVGGDLTNAEVLVVTVALTGHCEGPPVLRSGARPGDTVWVSGALGAAAAGLRTLRARGYLDEAGLALVAAHARPVPQIAAGSAARSAGATAMIDVSDGLLADLTHICAESGVGFRLDQVPVAPGATVEEALRGGEDFALVFCAPPSVSLGEAFIGLHPPVRLGTCSEDPRERRFDGEQVDTKGWEHQWKPRPPSS
jgi:thiamine-monophosphate kinase